MAARHFVNALCGCVLPSPALGDKQNRDVALRQLADDQLYRPHACTYALDKSVLARHWYHPGITPDRRQDSCDDLPSPRILILDIALHESCRKEHLNVKSARRR